MKPEGERSRQPRDRMGFVILKGYDGATRWERGGSTELSPPAAEIARALRVPPPFIRFRADGEAAGRRAGSARTVSLREEEFGSP